MPQPLKYNLLGQTFGHLEVLERATSARWLCQCACGKRRKIKGGHLRQGRMKSCGCLKGAMISKSKIRHELIDTRSYGIWEGMKNRCQNPRNRNYANYGGRGITVCERWQGFTAFFVDMGEAPPGLSLDRIDNDKGYSPDNCRWATALEQRLNQRPRGKNSSPRKRLATKTIPTEPMVIP